MPKMRSKMCCFNDFSAGVFLFQQRIKLIAFCTTDDMNIYFVVFVFYLFDTNRHKRWLNLFFRFRQEVNQATTLWSLSILSLQNTILHIHSLKF